MRKMSKLNANARKEPTASRPMNQVFLSHHHGQMPEGMIGSISAGILNQKEKAAKVKASKKGKKAEKAETNAQTAPSNLSVIPASQVVPDPMTMAPVNTGQAQPAPVPSSSNTMNVPPPQVAVNPAPNTQTANPPVNNTTAPGQTTSGQTTAPSQTTNVPGQTTMPSQTTNAPGLTTAPVQTSNVPAQPSGQNAPAQNATGGALTNPVGATAGPSNPQPAPDPGPKKGKKKSRRRHHSSSSSSSSSSSGSSGSSSSSSSSSGKARKRRHRRHRHRKERSYDEGIKVKPPPAYDCKADLDFFDQWAFKVVNYANIMKIRDRTMVQLVDSMLTGKAQSFYMMYVATRQDQWTIKTLIPAIFNFCFPNDIMQRLRKRWENMAQGKS
jgi:hypothetical protein